MYREEWARSDVVLRLDMPNRGRIGRVRPNDGDTTERRHTAPRGDGRSTEMQRPRIKPGKISTGQRDTTSRRSIAGNKCSQWEVSLQSRRGHHGKHAIRRGHPPTLIGVSETGHSFPVTSATMTNLAMKAPPVGGAFIHTRKGDRSIPVKRSVKHHAASRSRSACGCKLCR